jgi:hypothetical protein
MIKTVLLVLLIFWLAALTGCTQTKALLDASNYTEKFSAFYLSDDGKNLIIFTDDYHYVFGTPKDLVKVLDALYAKEMSVKFREFHVKEDNSIYGFINFSLKHSLSNKAIMDAAYSDGFARTHPEWITKNMRLTGMRYQSLGIKPKMAPRKLQKSYRVLIKGGGATGSLASKISETPITLIEDVVRIGEAAVVMPVFIGCAIKACY